MARAGAEAAAAPRPRRRPLAQARAQRVEAQAACARRSTASRARARAGARALHVRCAGLCVAARRSCCTGAARSRPAPVRAAPAPAPAARAHRAPAAPGRRAQFGARAAHAFGFDGIGRLAQAGGVHQRQFDAVQAQLSRSRSRVVPASADDRALVGGQRVQQRGLADVRRADDDHVQAVDQAHAARGGGAQRLQLPCASRKRALQRRRREESMSSSGKSKPASRWMRNTVSASTSASTRRENSPSSERRAARAAASLPARDQVGDRFGLREVELAFEEGALGELARARARAPSAQAAREQLREHDRAAVRLQLDHVFAGVGVRRAEIQRDAVVDARRPRHRGSARGARGAAPAACRTALARSSRARGPDRRTMPMPAAPAAVAMAAIVSRERSCAIMAGLIRTSQRG